MKLAIAVIIVASVIGGFVGSELMDSSFSITGALVGGVGAAAILLRLRAYFDAQKRKREEKALREGEEQEQKRREMDRTERISVYLLEKEREERKQKRREIEQKAHEAEIGECNKGISDPEERRDRARQFAQNTYRHGVQSEDLERLRKI